MFSLKQIATAATIGALSFPAAYANSGITPANTELGYTTHAMPASGVTRQTVRAAQEAFESNPVNADGDRFIGGEIGWVQQGHGYARRGGSWVHSDNIDHSTPSASTSVTPQSREQFRRMYPGG